MDIQKIKKRDEEKRSISINIRIKPSLAKWLNHKQYSPTGIFMEACKDLGYKDPQEKE